MNAAVLFLTILASAHHPDDAGQRVFVKSWQGRRVVVQQTLYSLVYNERGRLGNTRNGKRDGLVVVTPSQGVWFRFDGRQGRDDVEARNVQRIVRAVNDAYAPDSGEVRAYRKVEALAINRYEPGVELVVHGVTIDTDEVTFTFAATGDSDRDEPVTSLRVRWPLPLSNGFTERDAIEALVERFVQPAPSA